MKSRIRGYRTSYSIPVHDAQQADHKTPENRAVNAENAMILMLYISTVKSTAFCGRYRTHTALQNQAKTKENYHQNGGNL